MRFISLQSELGPSSLREAGYKKKRQSSFLHAFTDTTLRAETMNPEIQRDWRSNQMTLTMESDIQEMKRLCHRAEFFNGPI